MTFEQWFVERNAMLDDQRTRLQEQWAREDEVCQKTTQLRQTSLRQMKTQYWGRTAELVLCAAPGAALLLWLGLWYVAVPYVVFVWWGQRKVLGMVVREQEEIVRMDAEINAAKQVHRKQVTEHIDQADALLQQTWRQHHQSEQELVQ